MSIKYDSSEGIVAAALRFSFTIIPIVLKAKEFWILLCLNVFVCALRKAGLFHPEDNHVDLPWGLTGTTGGLMTFFVVFYNGHVFNRYNRLYDLTKAMSEHCLQACTFMMVQIPELTVRIKIAKLMLSSIFIFFFERTGTEDVDGDGTVDPAISHIEWGQLQKLMLLNDDEVEHLRKHCEDLKDLAFPSFLVLHWAMRLTRHVTPTPEDRDDMLSQLDGCIFGTFKCQSEITNIMELPMPFQYFHIMNLMLIINLVLWAYSLGCQDSYFAPFIYMFVQMMFQGIRELAAALSNPFGADDVDFPVNEWVRALYTQMYSILHGHKGARFNDLANTADDQSVPVLLQASEVNSILDVNLDSRPEPKPEDPLISESLLRRMSMRGPYMPIV